MSLLLLFRPSSSPDITVTADAGVLNLTATDPTPGESIAATVGTLVLSGLDSSLAESVPVDAGILVLNGPAPTVTGSDATPDTAKLVFPYHYYHWA